MDVSGTVPCEARPSPVPRECRAVPRTAGGNVGQSNAQPPRLPRRPSAINIPALPTRMCPRIGLPPRGSGGHQATARAPVLVRGTLGSTRGKDPDPCGSAPETFTRDQRSLPLRINCPSRPGTASRPRLRVDVRACEAAGRAANPRRRLELGRVLGEGSGGRVHLAVDRASTGRYYAVKTAFTPESRAAVRNELEMLVRVLPPHKNIVRVPAHLVPPPHEWESGSPYVPLEFARDGDLMDAAIELRRAGCTYRPRAVAELGRQLAEALRHCHAAGVYHRDVKPDNVLVFRAEGVLRLADFGCATTEARPLDCSTTECYAAPEVLRCRRNGRSAVVSGGEASASGRAARGYDAAAADVWSLGISLFALLAGRCPWQCATPHNSFFERYVTSGHFDAAVLAGASAGCEDAKAMDQMLALVQRMLSVEPTSRPTMEHLAGELAALASAVPHAPVTVNPSAPADAEGMDLVPSAASQALSLPTNGGDAVDIAALSDDSDDDDDETSAPARAELHTAEATADTPMRRAADFGITPVVRSASYVAGTCLESVGDVDEDLDGDTSDDDVPMSTSRVVDTGARV